MRSLRVVVEVSGGTVTVDIDEPVAALAGPVLDALGPLLDLRPAAPPAPAGLHAVADHDDEPSRLPVDTGGRVPPGVPAAVPASGSPSLTDAPETGSDPTPPASNGPAPFGPETIAWDVLTLLADDMAGTWEGSIGDLADEVGRGSRASTGAVIRKLGDAGLVQIVRRSPRVVTSVCLTRAGWDHLGRHPQSSGIDGFTITPPEPAAEPVDLTAPPMEARGPVDVDAARARAADASFGW